MLKRHTIIDHAVPAVAIASVVLGLAVALGFYDVQHRPLSVPAPPRVIMVPTRCAKTAYNPVLDVYECLDQRAP